MIFARIEKPQHAGVLGKIGPYLPCSTLSLKNPPFGIAIAAGLVQLVCFDASDMAYAFPGLVVLLLFELTRQEPFLSGMTWINAIGQGAMNQRTGRTRLRLRLRLAR